MNIEEARELFKNKIGLEISSIEQVGYGGDSVTYKITTPRENYILRSGGKKLNYDVEHAVLRILLEKNAKVPIPVAENIDLINPAMSFSLLEELSGVDLFSSDLPYSYWPKLMRQIGNNMKIVYSVKMEGFGPVSVDKFRINGELVGGFNSYLQYVNYYFDSRMESFVERILQDKEENFKDSTLSREQINKVLEIIKKLPEVKKRIEDCLSDYSFSGTLVHGDLHPQHVLIDNGNVEGIIDLNNISVAEPLFDMAYWSIMPKGKNYKELAKASGVRIEEKRFGLYRLVISVAKLHTRYITHNYLNRYPEILDFALDELNK